jgi:hypothetical protein
MKAKRWRMPTKFIRLVCCNCKALTGVRLKPSGCQNAGRQVSHGVCEVCGPVLYPNLWPKKG